MSLTALTFLVYIAGIVGNIGGVLVLAGLIAFGWVCFCIVMKALAASPSMDFDDDDKAWAKGLKPRPWLPVVVFLVSAAIPDEKSIYIIAGANLANQVATSPAIQQNATDLFGLVKGALQAEIDNLKKDEKR